MGTKTRHFAIEFALLILVLLILLDSPGAFARPNTAIPTMHILVLDYADVPPRVLAEAEQETSRIFGPARLQFRWTDCGTRQSPHLPSPCEGTGVAGEIRLRILPRPLNHNFANSVFGFATAPTYASVYYESARRLIQTVTDSNSNISVILGCLIAHEIGHLLLGTDQHTASGIMQASWDIHQIQRALRGTLGFSSQQAERMRQSVAVRVSASLE